MEILVKLEQPKSSIFKERWTSQDNDPAYVANMQEQFRVVGQKTTDDSYEDLAKEIRDNHALPKCLTILPEKNYNRWNQIEVFRYPVFVGSYRSWHDNPPKNQHANLTKRAKSLCLKHGGTIILNKGGTSLSYEVSSKKIAVDGNFVISRREGHCVMEHNPKRAAKIRKSPLRTLDPFHRRGLFRTTELSVLLWLFQSGVQYHPKFKHLIYWIKWWSCDKPKEESMSKMIPRACAAYTHVYQGPKYRSDSKFIDILAKAKVVIKYAKKNGIPMPPWRKNLYAFLKREIRIAVMAGKMV